MRLAKQVGDKLLHARPGEQCGWVIDRNKRNGGNFFVMSWSFLPECGKFFTKRAMSH